MIRSSPVPLLDFSAKLAKYCINNGTRVDRIGVAVSGGADSMALCTLLQKHRERTKWPEKVIALTVDHGVREESAKEAAEVGRWVKQLGFEHTILRLPQDMANGLRKTIPKDIETQLRMSRANLLTEAAENHELPVILTAHQEDDQYETLLHRLSWGSHLVGLSGIPEANGCFRRPLLDYSKEQLKATCEEYKTPWVEDPTNSDPTFGLRNALRKMVQNQEDLPVALRKENVLRMIERGRKFREQILMDTNKLLSECKFMQGDWTGVLKAFVPATVYNYPRELHRHFIAGLCRIFHNHKIENYTFLGLASDRVSKEVVKKFWKAEGCLRQGEPDNVNYAAFDAQRVQFRYIPATDGHYWSLYPQKPRRNETIDWITPVKVNEDPGKEWKSTSFKLPSKWFMPHKFTIFVKEDKGYYLRSLFQRPRRPDMDILKKVLTDRQYAEFDSTFHLDSSYPPQLYPVLCHTAAGTDVKNTKIEWIDSIPQFRLDIAGDVHTICDRKFDGIDRRRGQTFSLMPGKIDLNRISMEAIMAPKLLRERYVDEHARLQRKNLILVHEDES